MEEVPMKNWSFKKKLLVSSTVITLVVILGLSSLILYHGTQEKITSLHKKMDLLATSLASSTKNLVWNIDLTTISVISKQISKDPEVNYVIFYDGQNKPLIKSDHTKIAGEMMIQKKMFGENKEVIGSIHISYNDDLIQAQVVQSITTILGLALFGEILIYLGLLFVIRGITDGLIASVNHLNRSSEASKESSIKLKEASLIVSATAEEQASAIQETVASLDEITEMVRTSANRASESSDRSEDCYKVTMEGKESITEMNTMMNKIVDSNRQIDNQLEQNTKNMDGIVDTIREIATKTEVINDIVFQTKLLSFNASVEAARAGEAGKGFAVVAEEIGNLATMSGGASTEISQLLSSSMDKVSSIAKTTKIEIDKIIEEGQTLVDSMGKIITQNGVSFDQVVTNVTEVNKLMKEMARAVEEQSLGVQNITDAMRELDRSVQRNSEAASATHTQAERVSGQSDDLDTIIQVMATSIYGFNGSNINTPFDDTEGMSDSDESPYADNHAAA